MAATTTTAAGALADALAEPFVNAITTQIPFLKLLADRGNVKLVTGEQSIKWPVRSVANSSAGSYAQGTAVPAAGSQTIVNPELAWKRNWVIVESDNLLRAVGRGDGIVGPFPTAWLMELELGLKDMLVQVESQLLSDGTGNSSADITGIYAPLSDSTTYAGIAQGANTYWQASQQSAAGATVTWELMEQIKDTVLDLQQPGQDLNAALCSRTQYRLAKSKFMDRMRNADGQFDPGTLAMEDTVFVPLKGYTTTRIDFVDLNLFEYHILLQPEETEGNGWMTEELPTGQGFPVNVSPYDPGTDSKGVKLTLYSQLVCRWPRACGTLHTLATS